MSLAARHRNFGTRFHNFLYQRLNLNFIYKAFTTTDIAAAVGGLRALGIRGCAISMPFKESCMAFIDENTIVNTNGRLTGSNTDYIAVRDLLLASKISPAVSFALFGSGGMAKAVACALKDLGFKNGLVIGRNEKSGTALANQYGFSWASAQNAPADLLINASPVGMRGANEEMLSPFSDELVKKSQTIFDVVAMPNETHLIKSARAQGKQVITGFEVQTIQALEQFARYTGVRPEQSLVEEAAHFARS